MGLLPKRRTPLNAIPFPHSPWRPLGEITGGAVAGYRSYWVKLTRPDAPGARITVLLFPVAPFSWCHTWAVHRAVAGSTCSADGTETCHAMACEVFRSGFRNLAEAEEAAFESACAHRDSPPFLWDGIPGPHCRAGITQVQVTEG